MAPKFQGLKLHGTKVSMPDTEGNNMVHALKLQSLKVGYNKVLRTELKQLLCSVACEWVHTKTNLPGKKLRQVQNHTLPRSYPQAARNGLCQVLGSELVALVLNDAAQYWHGWRI